MSDLQRIEETLKRTAWRRRWLRGWKALGQGTLAGGLIFLLTFLVYKLFPIPEIALPVAAIIGGVVLLGFLVHAILRRVDVLETARWVDNQRNLKERISTALEVAHESPTAKQDEDPEWRNLIISDAARHVSEVEPREMLPVRFAGAMRWAMLVLVLAVGLGFIPEYRTQAFKQKEKDAAKVKEIGKKLTELTRKNLIRQPSLLPPTQKAMNSVTELGTQMQKAKLTRNDALRDLAKATDKIREQQKELGDNPAMKSLERAAREPSKSGPMPGDLQKQIESLQKALGNKAPDASKMEDIQEKLEALKKSAAGMPKRDTPEGKAAQQKMAQALAQLAAEANAMGASLPDLQKAIESLKNDQTDLFIRDLQAAMKDLDKMKQMAKAMQQMKQQASKLGKDLAEQLKNGQAQAAQKTLQKMIDKLGQSGLSNQQKQDIMKEVAKAVNPAGDYGKVAEHLKNAVQQMQQNQKSDAAQSLASAKDELQKMMDQMADSDALQSALNALERAQMALASDKSWEQTQKGYCSKCGGGSCQTCKGQGKQGRFGEGGKPGAGVGTWADENGGWMYDVKQEGMVDNSGIERPDMEGRGITERNSDLNPNLNPTKVRGQMSPGGSMPSITLKGVHIKGQSNVRFEEAAVSAQAEAQSALNQDKVPRPYLNSVKDYFDDFKN